MADLPSDAVDDDVESVWGLYSTQILVGVIGAVVGVGTLVYHYLEDWGWIDSLYFSVVTLTTVGYGDLAPSTRVSKLFTVAYLVTGVSLLGAVLNEVTKRRRRRQLERHAHRR